MRFLVDTMVISEPARPSPEPRVLEWLRAQPAGDLAVSALTLGEVAKGVALMADGRRKRALGAWLADDLPALFRDRILAVDLGAAVEWGRLAALRRALPVVDGLLLGTAASHRLTLVTRNVRDTAGLGVPVLDPWTHRLYRPDETPD